MVVVYALRPSVVQAEASTKSSGDVLDGLRTCGEKTESLGRLDCYDRLARSATPPASASSAAAATTASGGTGGWQVDRKVNPLDDTPSYVAMLPADEKNAALFLRCKSGATEAYIGYMKYLGSDDATVTLRIGSGKAVTKERAACPPTIAWPSIRARTAPSSRSSPPRTSWWPR